MSTRFASSVRNLCKQHWNRGRNVDRHCKDTFEDIDRFTYVGNRWQGYLLPNGLTPSLAHTMRAMIRMLELLANRISKTGMSRLPKIFAKVSMEARKTELSA